MGVCWEFRGGRAGSCGYFNVLDWENIWNGVEVGLYFLFEFGCCLNVFVFVF